MTESSVYDTIETPTDEDAIPSNVVKSFSAAELQFDYEESNRFMRKSTMAVGEREGRAINKVDRRARMGKKVP